MKNKLVFSFLILFVISSCASSKKYEKWIVGDWKSTDVELNTPDDLDEETKAVIDQGLQALKESFAFRFTDDKHVTVLNVSDKSESKEGIYRIEKRKLYFIDDVEEEVNLIKLSKEELVIGFLEGNDEMIIHMNKVPGGFDFSTSPTIPYPEEGFDTKSLTNGSLVGYWKCTSMDFGFEMNEEEQGQLNQMANGISLLMKENGEIEMEDQSQGDKKSGTYTVMNGELTTTSNGISETLLIEYFSGDEMLLVLDTEGTSLRLTFQKQYE